MEITTEQKQKAAEIAQAIETYKMVVLRDFFGKDIKDITKKELKMIKLVFDFGGNEELLYPEKTYIIFKHEVQLGYIETTDTHMRWVTELEYRPLNKEKKVLKLADKIQNPD